MLLSICSDGDILKVIRLVKIVMTIIRFVVPILLIFSLSKDYLNDVKTGEVSKEFKTTSRKAIADVIIFLVPTFINVLIKVSDMIDVNNEYYDCIENATEEGIDAAYVNNAKVKIEAAKKSLNASDYNFAIEAYRKVNNVNEKNNLTKDLNDLKNVIEINREIDLLATNYTDSSYTNIYNKIAKVSNSEYKKELTKKISDVKTNATKKNNNYPSSSSMSGWILIGDSRFVGMRDTVGSSRLASDGVTIIAKSSMGYDWFVNTAINEVNNILRNNPNKKYYIYSNLGVNGRSTKYAATLNELAAGAWAGNIVGYISVNPYVGYSAKSIEYNQKIVNLNNDQKSKLINVRYCDTFNGIGQNNFTSSGDIVHYDRNTYSRIYEYIINNCR